MYPTDDLQARGALMVARAAAGNRTSCWCGLQHAPCGCHPHTEFSVSSVEHIRAVAASDAALARAIDAVPGVIGGPDALVIRSNGAHERI